MRAAPRLRPKPVLISHSLIMNQNAINYTAICEGESVRIVKDSKLIFETTRDELKAIFLVAGNVFSLEEGAPASGRFTSEEELRRCAKDYHLEVCPALRERLDTGNRPRAVGHEGG